MRLPIGLAAAVVFSCLLSCAFAEASDVKPGDLITPDNAAKVADLVSPGNLVLVKQGMQMKIVPTERLEWPPPYKTATEKYSPQVRLDEQGQLHNYVAGLPFPLLDPNDPQVAYKAMWNFSFRPAFTDDVDIRDVELASFRPGGVADDPIALYLFGHVGFYNNIGRTEVDPIPTDPDANTGIRYRFGAGPFVRPGSPFGWSFIRFRYMPPGVEDNVWMNGIRNTAERLSDILGATCDRCGMLGAFARTFDADSFFGFAAKIEDFDYKLLAVKPMLASVHAAGLPANRCVADGGRTICPENWELRQVYVIEADIKPQSWTQKIGNDGVTIPKRIIYIDSEGWFITASDQYDREGKLWKTVATFNTYRDHSSPGASTAVRPFKRIFQTAMVDEDVQTGISTVLSSPGHETPARETWFINQGVVTETTFTPGRYRTHRSFYEQ